MKKTNISLVLILFVPAILAFFIILETTSFGIGLSPDSLVYITAARNLLEGKGFQAEGGALTRFPPAYPTILALTGSVFGDSLNGARWLHAILFAVNSILVGLTAYILTDKKIFPAIFSSLLFVISVPTLKVHNMAWSESLFITFLLSASIMLLRYISKPQIINLIISAVFLGFAMITRYAGTVLFVSTLLVLLIFDIKPIKKRLLDGVILIAIGLIPFVIWMIRGHLLAGDIGGRQLAFHPIPAGKFTQFFKTVYSYWFPFYASSLMKTILAFTIPVALFIGATVLLILYYRETDHAKKIAIVSRIMLMIFVFIYMIFFLIALLFLDAAPTFDYRVLSPLHPVVIVIFISLCWSIADKFRNPAMQWIFIVAFIALISGHARLMPYEIRQMQKDGRGYTSRKWRDSECVEYAKSLGTEKIIFSNGYDVIAFFAGKDVECLPKKVYTANLQPNPDYEKEMKDMRNAIFDGKALIIFFEKKKTRWNIPGSRELEEDYGIPVLLNLDDGIIYGINGDDIETE